ncbi:MAG TPA: hypothetical protein VMU84_08555 [Thermoanaerobaculia bacterium]|nr:hypothetical protein [Thermoanaerobaculia bacterium]
MKRVDPGKKLATGRLELFDRPSQHENIRPARSRGFTRFRFAVIDRRAWLVASHGRKISAPNIELAEADEQVRTTRVRKRERFCNCGLPGVVHRFDSTPHFFPSDVFV